ncbi:MAG: hypothetical protein GYB68_16705, partial [Chloroflexi bacterium]|nr:hypothetical protein [Chloroflexota bacterium]
ISPHVVRLIYVGRPGDGSVAIGVVYAAVFQQYATRLLSFQPALNFEDKVGRRYYNVLAPHVLGYVGFIQEEQCAAYEERGYRCDELIGQAGLEQWGESYLAGTRGGELNLWTATGNFVLQVAAKEAEPAQSIYTTLDRDLQAAVQDALEEAYQVGGPTWVQEAGGAAVVVLDVNSGAVLAMASFPHFDPNALHPFNGHPYAVNGNYLADVLNQPLRPLLNRAAQSAYPAGSVFKVVTATAGLESGLFPLDYIHNSTGIWCELGPTDCRNDWNEDGFGPINLCQALTASSNTFFYQVGYDLGNEEMGLLAEEAREYGYGAATGIEIDEQSGSIPDPFGLTSDGRQFSVPDNVNLAIGQGDVLVTPLQVALMMATVANGGTVYEPHLVDRIGLIGEEPSVVTQPQVIREMSLDPELLATIRECLNLVTSDPVLGTAEWRLGSLPIDVAGKTGTAQVSGTLQPNAWFAGFAPYDEPEIAVAVLVENGGQGSAVAAPIFRRVVEAYLGLPLSRYPNDWTDPDEFDFVGD